MRSNLDQNRRSLRSQCEGGTAQNVKLIPIDIELYKSNRLINPKLGTNLSQQVVKSQKSHTSCRFQFAKVPCMTIVATASEGPARVELGIGSVRASVCRCERGLDWNDS